MRILLLALLLINIVTAQAQNLVPNGSFEQYTTCPTNVSQVERAVGWSTISLSPDYFNRCSATDTVSVPSNFAGFQDAFDGDAYMGMLTYLEGSGIYRECIQHQLASPLIPGQPVYLSMMASPGGSGSVANSSMRFASSGIGMKFSMQPHAADGLWTGNVALHLANVLNDTAYWVQVSGVYIPDSAYTYVAVGCFLPDSEITVQLLDPLGQSFGAYAFVDQICVSQNPLDYCQSNIGIPEMHRSLTLIGPNPVGQYLHLRVNDPYSQGSLIQLFDISGRLCSDMYIPAGTADITWPLDELPSGSYVVHFQNSLGPVRPIHIVHFK